MSDHLEPKWSLEDFVRTDLTDVVFRSLSNGLDSYLEE